MTTDRTDCLPYDEHTGVLLLQGFDINDPILQDCVGMGAVVIFSDRPRWHHLLRILEQMHITLIIIQCANSSISEFAKSLAALFRYKHLPWVMIIGDDSAQICAEWYSLGATLVLTKGASLAPVWSLLRHELCNESRHGNPRATAGRVHRMRLGKRIIPNSHSYWRLINGMIFVELYDQNDNVNIIDILVPGDIFINIESGVNQCSLYAAKNVIIHAFDSVDPLADQDFAAQMERQFRWSMRLTIARCERDLETRIYFLLTELSVRFGHQDGDCQIVKPDLTHAQIASFCGATRASVTRAINKLKRKKLLSDYINGETGRCLAVRL